MEPVTSVLIERARETEGLRTMEALSLVAHVTLLAAVLWMPPRWSGDQEHTPRTIMTVSLGGAPGPRAGGLTPMGGRPIQSVAPMPSSPRAQPVAPPAAKTPEMTLPAPGRKTTPVTTAPEDARGRMPTKGQEERAGTTVADTGGRGVGFGLSTGGGGTGGYLEVGNFCCPEYLTTMIALIQRNWNAKQQVPGESLVKFTIQRDGRITGVELEQSSGYAALDLTAQRALLLTRQLPPLPAAFPDNDLTVHLRFQYQR